MERLYPIAFIPIIAYIVFKSAYEIMNYLNLKKRSSRSEHRSEGTNHKCGFFCTLFKYFFKPKNTSEIIKHSGHIYEIKCCIEGRPVRLLVKMVRGPKPNLTVMSDGVNVSEHVLPYLYINFNPVIPTPKLLGYHSLKISEQRERSSEQKERSSEQREHHQEHNESAGDSERSEIFNEKDEILL